MTKKVFIGLCFVAVFSMCQLAAPLAVVAQSGQSGTGGQSGQSGTGGSSGQSGVGAGTGQSGIGGQSGQSGTGGQGVTLMNPLKVDSLEDLLVIVLKAVVRIGTIVLTLMLIWVGFLFIKARGNPNEISTARTALVWTIVGGLILLGAEAIGRVIQATANTL